ncbi:hypothetical protein [Cellulomonas cellasea]|uniref:Uncharacterized protein n=1 Tax=Cellulomonas cellasea TaxID=43670 RepID=A0A7W4YDK5_9CELL|nr:hypothetical protein [Cellulomonas cellasea]MBB2924656.1 hypothetical protein [Cellulomonas cellasea]
MRDERGRASDGGAVASPAERRTPEQRTRASSAHAFALQVVTRLAAEGIDAEAEVTPVWVNEAEDGSYLVSVLEGGAAEVLCEVTDGVPDVRVMDPHGVEMSPDQALAYVVRRAHGGSARDAAEVVWPSARRWRVRLLRRRGVERPR